MDRQRTVRRRTCASIWSGSHRPASRAAGPRTTRPRPTARRSGVLDRDPLDDVGDVLGLVDRVLQQAVDILPLDEIDRIGRIVEEACDRRADDAVALVLEAMDLDPVFVEPLEALQVGEGVVEELDLLDDDRGLLDRRPGRGLDPIEDKRVGGLLDEIENVVQGADERVDVLAVERRDERGFKAMADVMTDFVAAMLRGPNL